MLLRGVRCSRGSRARGSKEGQISMWFIAKFLLFGCSSCRGSGSVSKHCMRVTGISILKCVYECVPLGGVNITS